MQDTPLVSAAKTLAGEAHHGQFRKYTDLPYIIHPIEVMQIVQSVEHDEAMLAAALLHDVVEDCEGYTFDTIKEATNDDVADLVRGLTDVAKPEDGNRATRKAIEKDRLAKEGARVQTVKLADIISNSRDIELHDPKFAKVYNNEMKDLLTVMKKGNKKLYGEAYKLVHGAFE